MNHSGTDVEKAVTNNDLLLDSQMSLTNTLFENEPNSPTLNSRMKKLHQNAKILKRPNRH